MADVSNMKTAGRRVGLACLALDVFSITGYLTLTVLLAGTPHSVIERLAASQIQFILALASSVIGFAPWIVLGLLYAGWRSAEVGRAIEVARESRE